MPGKKLTAAALLAAAAVVLSILESLLFGGLTLGLPGIKLGLANIAVLVALKYSGTGTAYLIGVIKSLASFFAAGSVTVLWYSLAGTLLAVTGMWLMDRYLRCFSLIGVSAFGGFLSNLGQLLVMMLLSHTAEFLFYLPVLTIAGTAAGCLSGLLAAVILSRLGRAERTRTKI